MHLAKLDTLETLALSSDRLTRRGLAYLARLPNLKHLSLHGLRPPNGTFAPLKDFAALEVLNLGDYRLTDELLATLPRSDQVKSLSLEGAHKVTDEGIRHLLRLPYLEELNLLHTKMTPDGMETISSLRELRKLVPALVFDTVSPLPIPKQIEQGAADAQDLPP